MGTIEAGSPNPPPVPSTITIIESVSDLQQGPNAVKWLKGDFLGNGSQQIVQAWDNDSTLGMILYGQMIPAGQVRGAPPITQLWASDDMGEGPGAVAWKVGRFHTRTKDEIVQAWRNGSSLGMIVYGSDDGVGLTKRWTSPDMGQGPGAVAWKVGDFDGDGNDELVQAWGNGSALGLIVYGSDGGNGLTQLWSSSDMGAGPGAVAWKVGRFTDTARDQLVQLWKNGSTLGMTLYESDGGKGLQQIWSSGDMGAGPGALAWTVGDFNGDGYDEIIQLWKSQKYGVGALGMTMFGCGPGGGLALLTSSDYNGSYDAATWKVGDFDGDGRAEIIRVFSQDSYLGLQAYGVRSDGTLGPLVLHGDADAGPGAVTWKAGAFMAPFSDVLVQMWANGSALGMYVYGTMAFRSVAGVLPRPAGSDTP